MVEEVTISLPWLIPMEASGHHGRCAEVEWPMQRAWSQVHTTADGPVACAVG